MRPDARPQARKKPEVYSLEYIEDFFGPRTMRWSRIIRLRERSMLDRLLDIIVLSPTSTSHTLGGSRTCAIRIVTVTHK